MPGTPAFCSPALRIPGDITIFNAKAIQAQLRSSVKARPERIQGLVARYRFDLVLAQADPEREEDLFLSAAFHAGQQDLVARYQAVARRWRLASETEPQGRTTPLETMLRINAIPIAATRQYILRVLGDRERFRFYLGEGGR